VEASDISWVKLAIGSVILIVPVLIFSYYKTGLVRATLISFLRMAGQLVLVGFYLKYIFLYNSVLVNIFWVVLMVFIASFTVVRRSDLKQSYFYIPVFTGLMANILINGSISTFFFIDGLEFFNARYIIPIMGMFIGNTLNGSIIGLRSFYKSLTVDEERYRYYLSCGATKSEASFPFFRDALKDAFNPTIASTATIGLIWLPGMMTGQILGGTDPMTSIKYQIMIIIGIFVGMVISVFVSLLLSQKIAFNSYGLLNKAIFVNK
jgi:putative ABC transport system permease protein